MKNLLSMVSFILEPTGIRLTGLAADMEAVHSDYLVNMEIYRNSTMLGESN